MADIGTTMKNAWVKGMEAIGNAANQLASNTKFKVNEMNLINHRKEILDGFGEKAYALWKDGAALPEDLAGLLKEVSEIDEQLAAIRAEHSARTEEEKADEAETAPEAPAEDPGLQGKSNPDGFAPTMQVTAEAAVEAVETDDALPTLEVPSKQEMENTLAQVSQSIDSAMERLNNLGAKVSQQVDQVVEDLDKGTKD